MFKIVTRKSIRLVHSKPGVGNAARNRTALAGAAVSIFLAVTLTSSLWGARIASAQVASKVEGAASQQRGVDTVRELPAVTQERLVLAVRQARLSAEKQGLDDIPFSKELKQHLGDQAIAKSAREEQLALGMRIRKFRAQIEDLERTKRLAQYEIKSADFKRGALVEHIALLRKAMEPHNALTNKGNSLLNARLNLAQRLLDCDLIRTDLELVIARSREEIARVERWIADARDQYQSEILADLNETEDRLASVMVMEANFIKCQGDVAACKTGN